MKKILTSIAGLVLAMPIIFAMLFWEAFVFKYVWDTFIISYFNLEPIGLLVFVGFNFCFHIVKGKDVFFLYHNQERCKKREEAKEFYDEGKISILEFIEVAFGEFYLSMKYVFLKPLIILITSFCIHHLSLMF